MAITVCECGLAKCECGLSKCFHEGSNPLAYRIQDGKVLCTGYKPRTRIPANNFLSTLHVNVNNTKLTDAQFREFVRNSLSIVEYKKPVVSSADCVVHWTPQGKEEVEAWDLLAQ